MFTFKLKEKETYSLNKRRKENVLVMLHVCQVCLNNANIRCFLQIYMFSETKQKAYEFGIEVGIGDSFRPGLILRKMGPEKY